MSYGAPRLRRVVRLLFFRFLGHIIDICSTFEAIEVVGLWKTNSCVHPRPADVS